MMSHLRRVGGAPSKKQVFWKSKCFDKHEAMRHGMEVEKPSAPFAILVSRETGQWKESNFFHAVAGGTPALGNP